MRPRVLVACEFSGRVRDAFIAQGCDAISCDLLPTERPGPHIQDDVRKYLNERWDLIIAHPPCRYLANSGARWRNTPEQQILVKEAEAFARCFFDAPVPRYCIENPMSRLSTLVRKKDQVIQPWQFGHPEQKTTWLWLKGLPLLVPTHIVTPVPPVQYKSGKSMPGWIANAKFKDRAHIRSVTFQGIADAFAAQWAPLLFQGTP